MSTCWWTTSSALVPSCMIIVLFFFKQKTAYEMRISDWSSDVCSSDLIIPAYGLLNARVTLNLDSPVMELSVWGRNITRKRYLTNVADFITSFGVAEGSIGEPRTYGVTLGYRF